MCSQSSNVRGDVHQDSKKHLVAPLTSCLAVSLPLQDRTGQRLEVTTNEHDVNLDFGTYIDEPEDSTIVTSKLER